jgi:hypothetical protein
LCSWRIALGYTWGRFTRQSRHERSVSGRRGRQRQEAQGAAGPIGCGAHWGHRPTAFTGHQRILPASTRPGRRLLTTLRRRPVDRPCRSLKATVGALNRAGHASVAGSHVYDTGWIVRRSGAMQMVESDWSASLGCSCMSAWPAASPPQLRRSARSHDPVPRLPGRCCRPGSSAPVGHHVLANSASG